MLSTTEITTLNLEIEKLVGQNKVDEALAIVREKPLIFCELPPSLRDNDSFALIAMSRLLQVGTWASTRLKSDIDFFIKAFNAYSYLNPINLASAHDIIFMLEYAKAYDYYRHEITEKDVTSRFACSPDEASLELGIAHRLIALANKYEAWLTNEKKECLGVLETMVPSFEAYSYHYAFTWAYGTRSVRRASEYF